MIRRNPSRRNRTSASGTSGGTTTSAIVIGEKGLPSRTSASLRTPSRSRNTAFTVIAKSTNPFPLRLPRLERRMCNQKMPHHGLKGLRVRRDRFRVDCRNDTDGVRYFSREAAVAADDTNNGRTDFLGIL